MSSRRTMSTITEPGYPPNFRAFAMLLRLIGIGMAIAALVLAGEISSKGGNPVFGYVASIYCLVLNIIDLICLLNWTRVPPGGLIFLDTIAVGFCVGGILNNQATKYNSDGDNGGFVNGNHGQLILDSDILLGILLAVHVFLVLSSINDCMWIQQNVRRRSRHGSSRSRSTRSGETVERVRVTRTTRTTG